MDRKAKKQKDRQQTMRLLAMISQFGINMLVPIFLCFFAGRWLDGHFGTSYWTVVLFFAGALAGFRNVFIFARRFMGSNDTAEGAPEVQRPDEGGHDQQRKTIK
ncbi:MAG: AtpZ/AtpI family protein [Lachnospiraceae bacterium]|nr:AtpZ/AtpI family protein [Lachnospiraceae bacterium]